VRDDEPDDQRHEDDARQGKRVGDIHEMRTPKRATPATQDPATPNLADTLPNS
jgi:hypothetical protein